MDPWTEVQIADLADHLEPVSKRAARVQADQTLVVSLVRVTKFMD